MSVIKKILLMLLLFFAISCRGTTMKDPPIHLNPNMDNVGRVDPQSKNNAMYFDGDSTRLISPHGASMLIPVENTFPRENNASSFDPKSWMFSIGRNEDSSYIESLSSHYEVDEKFILRGKERYNINCSPCHGLTGDGSGIVASDRFSWNKLTMPSDFHKIDSLYEAGGKDEWGNDGYIYEVISNGYGAMSAYKDISVEDRWKIVAYVRALTYEVEK
tara:strand:- start:728 stop:1378 length:651 start_codon:yes stop_codon:yes gene_type:complete